MKKRLMAGLLAGIMTISLAMPATAAVKAEKITIKGKNTVTVGKTIELDSVITPKKAKVKDRNIIWRSSDSSIAKVLETKDDDTKIKGIKAGTATITVKIKGTSIKNTLKVTVKKASTTTTNLSSDTKKVAAYKADAKALKEKIKKLTLASSASARKTQYCTYEQKIDAIDKKLDKIDDKWEKQWKITLIKSSIMNLMIDHI